MRRFHDTARVEARLQSEKQWKEEDTFDFAGSGIDPEDEDYLAFIETITNDMKFIDHKKGNEDG